MTIPTIYDWLTPQQRADVANRAQQVDVSGAVQSAINYVGNNRGSSPMGILYAPAGTYRLDHQIFCPYPISIVGAGQGLSWMTPSNTEFAWYGGNVTMLHWGRTDGSFPMCGGGLSRIALNGRAVASTCLKVIDASNYVMESLYIASGTRCGLELTNTNTQPNPSFGFQWRNIDIIVRGGGTDSADGIWMHTPGPITGPSGVAKGIFDGIKIQHANGCGLHVDGGDNHEWHNFWSFRSAQETGPGIWLAHVGDDMTEGGHMFLNCCANGGVVVEYDGMTNFGTAFINYNDYDLQPNAAPFGGAGVPSIRAWTTKGKYYGAPLEPT